MTKISVIIPVYNVENYLRECLESVVNQTMKDIEIICVDDCGTDNSMDIVKEFSIKDSRIRIVKHQKNLGLGPARNTGMYAANGDYIFFLDSDDYIDKSTLEILYNSFENNDIDFAVTRTMAFADDDSKETVDRTQNMNDWLDKKCFERYEITPANYEQVIVEFNCVSWGKLFKREFLIKNNLYFIDGNYAHEDNGFWLKVCACFPNVRYVEHVGLHYRIRKNAITANIDKKINRKKKLKHMKVCIADAMQYINNNIEPKFKKYLKQCIKDSVEYSDYFAINNHFLKYKWAKNDKRITILGIPIYREKLEKQHLVKRVLFVKVKVRQINDKAEPNDKKSFLKNIFSITNSQNHKKFTFCFCSIKIHKKYIYKLQCLFLPIVKNKIVFNNFNGNGYGCNPKYIAEEIIRQNLPYELVWLVKNVEQVKEDFPKEIRLVEFNIKNAIKEFASAKVWISNQRMPQLYENGLFKKKEQYYIQTWHGWTPIKQIEKDIETKKQWWCKWAKIDSQYIDLLTSSSQFDKSRLSQCFYFDGEICDVGIPRDDIFYYNDKEKNIIIDKIYTIFNIPRNNKILLYVPTFRDDGNLDCYDININSCLSVLEQKYNTKFSVITRLHPNIQETAKKIFKDNIIDATNYPDVMELLLASDVMISDYSSLMFEFMLIRKPVFLYGCDLDNYLKERNFYIDIKSLFFPFAETNEQLVKNIQNFDREKYLNDVNEFIKKSGSKNDGKASKFVVNRVKEVI